MQKVGVVLFLLFAAIAGAAPFSVKTLEHRAAILVKECPRDFFLRSREVLVQIPEAEMSEAYTAPTLGHILKLAHPDLIPSRIAYRATFLDCWIHLKDYQKSKQAADYQSYTTCVRGLGIGRETPELTKLVLGCLR